ncbi:MAG: phosphatase PAP2 family protein [Chloroflexi bacterium]|nr:phosphatase PAP2 family protein [Chloroflexota bacterium]
MKRSPFVIAMIMASAPLAAPKYCARAAEADIQTAGEVLTYFLQATAAALTLGHKDGPGALQLVESAGVTFGVTLALKYSIHAERPNGGEQSFPSGHTSVSFSAAEFMRKRYGWVYGVPAYAAASFVAYSRVESRQHYSQDVLAGAGIGILTSYLFTKPYKGWRVSMEGSQKSFGIKLARKF